jgi:hypothetical protein
MLQDKYKTILTMVIGFLVLSLIFEKASDVLFYIALGVGVVSLLSSRLADGILWIWEKIAFVLGWINTRIILSAIFFLFLVPISLVYRLFSTDPLRLKKPKDSNFIEVNKSYTPKDLEKVW